jgi:transposase InsO family protein
VRGDYPNHLVLIDRARIPVLFPFPHLHLMLVLDACSRLPLAAAIRFFEPSAADAVALQCAIRVHGKPRHIVMDQGSQFTRMVQGLPGQPGNPVPLRKSRRESHSLGSLKASLGIPRGRAWSFRGFADFKHRLELAFVHYSFVRPHAALDGATPIEKYYSIRGHLPTPVRPPRGRPGETPRDGVFEIVFLDPDNDAFPIVVPKAA